MATLAELSALRTGLDVQTVDHLLRLTASWSLLADLSFSDMVLLAPVAESDSRPLSSFVVLAQVRPNNRSTAISDDLVGTIQRVADWELALTALERGARVEGDVTVPGVGVMPTWCIPVRWRGEVVAVLVRLQSPLLGPASLYEQVYLSIFDRLCTMVSEGAFPFPDEEVAGPGLPRIGDGVILLDRHGRVEFATPNAVNALHRLGIYSALEGHTLGELGVTALVADRALAEAVPVVEECDRGHDVAIFFHCVPIITHGEVTGVLTLLRDVSDLRQLNRVVLSKEAAVREVHHRVKNNLQTISSLLRLQARRSDQLETVNALQEAERRVRSIAVVHEVLSREPGEEVVFDEIVQSIVTLVYDTAVVDLEVEIVVDGALGTLATDVATPLSVTLAELLTNAVEHAFVDLDEDFVAVVTVMLRVDDGYATVEIRDNGRGLGTEFSLDRPTSLGLSIVRDLIRAQLGGELTMQSVEESAGGGTYVRVRVPVTRD